MISLHKGDTIAVVSLSSGILGEPGCAHQVELGSRRLQELGLNLRFMPHALKGIDYVERHPQQRAEDLLAALADPGIQGILCAIGGIDGFRLAPYLRSEEARAIIAANPKLFIGYSDSTVHHLMLYQAGLHPYYGMSFLTCFADLGPDILPYSKRCVEHLFTAEDFVYTPSAEWYEERRDFSPAQLGIVRVSHADPKGYELLQGEPVFHGRLIGGCVESLYDLLEGTRHPEEIEINRRWQILPPREAFHGAVLFLETSEDQSSPETLETMLRRFADYGMLEDLRGLLFAKPQDEAHYEAYKPVLRRCLPADLPILYNLNFGHSYPKMLLQYGAMVHADADAQRLVMERL